MTRDRLQLLALMVQRQSQDSDEARCTAGMRTAEVEARARQWARALAARRGNYPLRDIVEGAPIAELLEMIETCTAELSSRVVPGPTSRTAMLRAIRLG